MATYLGSPVRSVWLRPINRRQEADAAKAKLTVPDGDHLTLLNVYNSYVQRGHSPWCHISAHRLRATQTRTIEVGP